MTYLLFIIGYLLFVGRAYAVCPVCTVAVCAGVGIAEKFGVDDAIIGLWVGALIVSAAWWTINWLKKKNWRFKNCALIIFAAYYLLTLAPLYYYGFIGKILNRFCGIDKLLLGIAAGSILFYAGERLHFYLKAKNNGKVYFPFQKVAVPVAVLIFISFIFYFLTK